MYVCIYVYMYISTVRKPPSPTAEDPKRGMLTAEGVWHPSTVHIYIQANLLAFKNFNFKIVSRFCDNIFLPI